jgi:hypothetical protein
MSLLRSVVASAFILLAAAGSAVAENRIALVIGNSAYQAVNALPNPANDASAVSKLLADANFEVISASDLNLDEMRRTIRDFSAKVAEKGENTVALVYYAGHGLQVDGENFLVPVDARIARASDVAIETMRLADIMTTLASTPSRTRIVILDACRNNPFSAVNAGGKGLAIVDAPAGSIVAYATAPGSEALDGRGRHSPYTAAFVKIARQPDLPIEQMFKRVRLLVHEATDSQQTPWESSSLTGDFAFFRSGEPATAEAPAQAPVQVASWREEIRTRSPQQAYDLVVMEDSVEAYEEYILFYPTHPLAERCRRLLARKAEALAWRHAILLNTPQAYANYLDKFPGGNYIKTALRLKERPRVRAMDAVIAPKVVVAPKPLRVTLPAQNGGQKIITGVATNTPNGTINNASKPLSPVTKDAAKPTLKDTIKTTIVPPLQPNTQIKTAPVPGLQKEEVGKIRPGKLTATNPQTNAANPENVNVNPNAATVNKPLIKTAPIKPKVIEAQPPAQITRKPVQIQSNQLQQNNQVQQSDQLRRQSGPSSLNFRR